MADEGFDPPLILPNPWVLDDLELIRQGVEVPMSGSDSPWAIPAPDAEDVGGVQRLVLTEPEGVPVADLPVKVADGGTYVPSGSPTLLSRRPDRPFELWHRGAGEVAAANVTIVMDRELSADEVARHLPSSARVLLLLLAAIERDGETQARDVALCRHAEGLRVQLTEQEVDLESVELAIAPVARDHPQRADRIAACAHAYGASGDVIDLTGAERAGEARTDGGAVLFFTGLSGSGKSTLAKAVRNVLLERTERPVTLLDGDVVRRHLSAGLGFSPEDRDRNVRRIGWVAARIAEHGGLAIASPIAPYEATRQSVAQATRQAGAAFLLVHVATPLAECERRDRKGLYARARRGEIPDFTGISAPYEEPVEPDLRLDTTDRPLPELVQSILDLGAQRGLWAPVSGS